MRTQQLRPAGSRGSEGYRRGAHVLRDEHEARFASPERAGAESHRQAHPELERIAPGLQLHHDDTVGAGQAQGGACAALCRDFGQLRHLAGPGGPALERGAHVQPVGEHERGASDHHAPSARITQVRLPITVAPPESVANSNKMVLVVIPRDARVLL